MSAWLLRRLFLMPILLGVALTGLKANGFEVNDTPSQIIVTTRNYTMKIDKNNFRYSFYKPDGAVWLVQHPTAGLVFLNSPVTQVTYQTSDERHVVINVKNELGIGARVELFPDLRNLKMTVTLDDQIKGSIIAQTQGLSSPAYGLGDHAARRNGKGTEVNGFSSKSFGALTDQQPSRLVSNFVIFPKDSMALVNVEPAKKVVKVTRSELSQGVVYGSEIKGLYYFFGTPVQIYKDFLSVRNHNGYKVYKPKYAWFGIGWEAWGALGWDTNHLTVRENIDKYLELGFPLDWMVVGSGFWAKNHPAELSTTSFGKWDPDLYPHPKAFIRYFHEKGMKFILGLRIAFIPNGPNTQEGIEKGYFIQKDGLPRLFKISFPVPECYFLNAHHPEALEWYIDLCDKWLEAGVDGFKEDLFGYEFEGLADDKIDPVNAALMDKGVYVMGRNGYLGSPMDLHRFEDFNYNHDQDRGPINGLAFAYSGFPYVYPDIVCGKGLHNMEFGTMDLDTIRTYFARNARYASLHPSMSFGYGVWNLNDDHLNNVVLDAARMHHRLQPFFYSAAVKTAQTGFPYSMTPLPLAYPQDDHVYYRENPQVRGYQWLIDQTLMACPLYGNDYATSDHRDVYLPKGVWIDYDNGKRYEGPLMLEDFAIPIEKTPLFVGGAGFLVEQKEGQLIGRIFETGFSGRIEFYSKDGSVSQIEIKGGSNIHRVVDETTGRQVALKKAALVKEFEFVSGHDYLIE